MLSIKSLFSPETSTCHFVIPSSYLGRCGFRRIESMPLFFLSWTRQKAHKLLTTWRESYEWKITTYTDDEKELAYDGIYYFALWSDNILTNIFKMFSFFARRLFVTCKGAKGDEHSFLTCSSRIFFEWKLFCTWTIAVQLFPFWWTICILRLLLEIPAKTFCFKAEIVLCSLFSCSCFRRSPWEFRLF